MHALLKCKKGTVDYFFNVHPVRHGSLLTFWRFTNRIIIIIIIIIIISTLGSKDPKG